MKFKVSRGVIFFKFRQYRTEKILKNIFFCYRTASLGGKGLRRSLLDEDDAEYLMALE